MDELFDFIVDFFVSLVAGVALSFLIALPLMLLWNGLVPEIFGLKTISYWDAFGLYLLSNLLFKSTKPYKEEKHEKTNPDSD